MNFETISSRFTGIFLYERAHAALYEEPKTYMQISMAETEKVFESDIPKNYIILDVRRPDEFAGGHIPGAINLPNEDIGTEAPMELQDKSQTIYIYCRSGNRSKQAAGKLLAMGYSNLIECGTLCKQCYRIHKYTECPDADFITCNVPFKPPYVCNSCDRKKWMSQ